MFVDSTPARLRRPHIPRWLALIVIGSLPLAAGTTQVNSAPAPKNTQPLLGANQISYFDGSKTDFIGLTVSGGTEFDKGWRPKFTDFANAHADSNAQFLDTQEERWGCAKQILNAPSNTGNFDSGGQLTPEFKYDKVLATTAETPACFQDALQPAAPPVIIEDTPQPTLPSSTPPITTVSENPPPVLTALQLIDIRAAADPNAISNKKCLRDFLLLNPGVVEFVPPDYVVIYPESCNKKLNQPETPIAIPIFLFAVAVVAVGAYVYLSRTNPMPSTTEKNPQEPIPATTAGTALVAEAQSATRAVTPLAAPPDHTGYGGDTSSSSDGFDPSIFPKHVVDAVEIARQRIKYGASRGDIIYEEERRKYYDPLIASTAAQTAEIYPGKAEVGGLLDFGLGRRDGASSPSRPEKSDWTVENGPSLDSKANSASFGPNDRPAIDPGNVVDSVFRSVETRQSAHKKS